ncbi:hypothetical protein ABT297_12355 [Dactylosporangium sp. NPDC000555]|uniref:hypothetical protein n=1 Tax=Dactylosporangium sp. NPDC000555 TaxID=3154260 RepID=UPI00332F27DC
MFGSRMRGRRLAVAMACALFVVAAGGCARRQAPTGDGGAADLPDVSLGGVSCSAVLSIGASQAPAAPPAPEPLAAGFVPVSASRCLATIKIVAGEGEWQMREEQQATGPFDALVRALRAPSERRGKGPCLAIGILPVIITLTDAQGRTTVPALPQDACGLPAQAALQAIATLPWTTVAETKDRQTRGQLELESNCPGRYKPVIALAAADSHHGTSGTGPVFPGTAPDTLRVCRYTPDPAEIIELTGSGALAVGKLTTTTTLTGPAVATLVAALNAAPPVTVPCDRPQAPFALLGDSGVAVETGGCYRAIGADGTLRQLDASTTAVLAG